MELNDIYKDNENYIVKTFEDKEQWRLARKNYIGASDIACACNCNPYKTREKLIEEKASGIAEEITNSAIEYGTLAEEHIRELFRLSNTDKYNVFYKADTMFVDTKHNGEDKIGISYSPDGILEDINENKLGILEIKTTKIHNERQLQNWDNQIPQNYYCQVLQGLLVTNFDFIVLVAEISFDDYLYEKGYCKMIKEYKFNREDLLEDLEFIKAEQEKIIEEIENKKTIDK